MRAIKAYAAIFLFLFIVCLIPTAKSTWNETTKDYQGYSFSVDAEWMMPNQDISNNFFIWESDFDAYDTLNPWSYSDNSHYIYAATYVDDWYEGIFGMTEPVNETSESGYYNITLICIYQTRSTGSMDCGYYFGYMLASGTSLMSDRYNAHNGIAYTSSFNHWEGNPDTGLPFTIDDLNDISIRILAYEDGTGAVTMKVTRAILIAQPVADPGRTDADFILRPEADFNPTYSDGYYFYNWNASPSSPITWYDKLNETTFHGDGDATYVTSNGSFYCAGFVSMTDLSEIILPGQYFSITLWVIAKTGTWDWSNHTYLKIGVITANQFGYPVTQYSYYLTPAWSNYTVSIPINPYTGSSWTYNDINNLCFYFGILSESYEISSNITQLAIIVDYSEYTSIFFPTTPIVVDEYFSVNMFGIIWLLAIFIPALALETQLSTIGFVAGAGLMLIVLNVALNGFFPVLIISLVGLGACFWGEKRG